MSIKSTLSNGKKNYIFGTGGVANAFFLAVRALYYEIDGFIVNSGYKKSDNFLQRPVFTVSDFIFDKDKCNIFVALYKNHARVSEELAQKGYDNLIYINYEKDIPYLQGEFYQKYLVNKKVDITKQVLNLGIIDKKWGGGFCMLNPFLKDEKYLLMWLLEAGDLILPEIFNDFSCIDEGPYEQGNVSIEKGDIVLDCGANIGLFSVFSAYKGAEKVYAFEPIPQNQVYIKEVSESYDNQISIMPYAVSNEVGKTSFNVQQQNLSSGSLKELSQKEGDYSIEVDITTIDKFVEDNNIKKVDFIKADIEGAERDMLIGAKNTIKRFGPKIAICTYHLEDDPEVLEKIIKDISSEYKIEHKWKKLFAYI